MGQQNLAAATVGGGVSFSTFYARVPDASALKCFPKIAALIFPSEKGGGVRVHPHCLSTQVRLFAAMPISKPRFPETKASAPPQPTRTNHPREAREKRNKTSWRVEGSRLPSGSTISCVTDSVDASTRRYERRIAMLNTEGRRILPGWNILWK